MGLGIRPPTKKNLTGITGDKLGVKGALTLTVQICNVEKQLTFIVVEQNDIFIIGIDGMTKFGLSINMESNCITCGNFVLEFNSLIRESYLL